MRLVLFTGPGGSGTTTLLAATAAALASRGVRVLAVSTGPGLADVLDVPLGDAPLSVAGDDSRVGPDAVCVDVAGRVRRTWTDLRPSLSELVGRHGPVAPTAADLLEPPGAAELAVWGAVRGWIGSGSWDVVLVDAGPPGDAARLVAAPATLRRHLDAWVPPHHRATLGGLLALTPRGGAADALIGRLDAALDATATLLAGPGVAARLVTRSGVVATAATGRLAAMLSLHGVPVDGVVVRGGGSGSGSPSAGVPAPGLLLPGVRRWDVAEHPDEPIGTAALGRLGVEVYGELSGEVSGDAGGAIDGDRGPLPAPSRPDGDVRPDGDRFLLDLALPHVDRADLELTRVADDLVLTVAGHRRLHPLSGVLTRCTVDAGELSGGRLRVWFRPDPELWPDVVPTTAAGAR